MLGAAFLSAAQGAATMGLNQVIAVSQASVARAYAANPEGAYGGNDSGEEVAEFRAHETLDSVLAAATTGGHVPSDEELLAATPPPDWSEHIKLLMLGGTDALGDPLSPDEAIKVVQALDRVNGTLAGAAELSELSVTRGDLLISKAPSGDPESMDMELML